MTDVWTVVIPRPLYARVGALLDDALPLEGGCYMTADWQGRGGAAGRLLVRDMVRPGPESWNSRGEGIIDPSSRYTHAAMVEAGRSERCLLFVHSHPSSGHPAGFSRADEAANARFFRDVSGALDGRPLASIVCGGEGIEAAVGHRGRIHRGARIDIVGRVLERHGGNEGAGQSGARGGGARGGGAHARQAAVLGSSMQGIVEALDVCVVGVGGVGSAVAVQMARMGVGRIRLVDRDLVEASNANRMYGCEPRHEGIPKVEAVGSHLRSFSASDIVEIRADVSDALGGDGPVASSDAVMCCTDNLRSRDRLNEAALRWHKPLIDAGCNVAAAGGGRRRAPESTAYAQLVTPETACLWCTGQIDGRRLGDEFLSGAQREAKEAAGYCEPSQPSLVTYTTWAACLAADKLLGFLGLYGDRSDASYVDIAGEFCRHRSPRIKEGCVCKEYRLWGGERGQVRGAAAARRDAAEGGVRAQV